MEKDFKQEALDYHSAEPKGKLQIRATKPMATQHDLSLAYSPGVAVACLEIARDPALAIEYTTRGNLVGVISNGTAVLGLGKIGALASKPVMEGKAVLFKKFAGVNVFDIEVDELDPKKLIEIVASLEPTFGGINLEDIKAPECFEVEEALRKRMNIPVFHDDQHGTAIIASTAIFNSLRIIGKSFDEVKLVCSGAGAAALACLNLLVSLGMNKENIIVCDSKGVINDSREGLDKYKQAYANKTQAVTLLDAIEGADIFLGCSMAGALTQDMVAKMTEQPVILALSNPVPEIMPELAKEVRPNAIIATGRSDYPNQVNNVLCFPFIFRGALDVGATTINEEMKIACVKALADLTMVETTQEVFKAYGESNTFGPDYIIPKPFDPRLISQVAPAVAKAAMESGVATRPIKDFNAYKRSLSGTVFRSQFLMTPVYAQAQESPRRLVFCEGESWLVLQAVQQLVDDKIAQPMLIGRPEVIKSRVKKLGLRLNLEKDVHITNIEDDERYQDYWTNYHQLLGRSGVTPDKAKEVIRTVPTVVGSLMLRLGDADAMICGSVGPFTEHVRHVREVIGLNKGVRDLSTVTCIILPKGALFICDSHITIDPSAEELAELAQLTSKQVMDFGIVPKVAFVSHSAFGSHENDSARKVRRAVEILNSLDVDFEFDGEMHVDSALDIAARSRYMKETQLNGLANVLIMPNIDSAHISMNLLKSFGDGISIGPLLLGAAKPVHVVTNSVSVRGLVNASALAVVSAQDES